jgi:hypothetical protein
MSDSLSAGLEALVKALGGGINTIAVTDAITGERVIYRRDESGGDWVEEEQDE